VEAALASLVTAVRSAVDHGTWARLKVCARDSCRWAYYDRSRNRSSRWCTMAGCGNIVKMRRAHVHDGAGLEEGQVDGTRERR
jgi:predicted RNA-binding Zn ribbon-like protein